MMKIIKGQRTLMSQSLRKKNIQALMKKDRKKLSTMSGSPMVTIDSKELEMRLNHQTALLLLRPLN